MSSSTNFFSQIQEAAPNVDVTLRIKEKNGRYTVMFQMETANKNSLRGINVTGTPAELDAGFFDKVKEAMQANKGLVTTVDTTQASEPTKDKAATASKKTSGEKAKAKQNDTDKEKGKKKKTKAAPAGPIPGDIFSQTPAPEEQSPAANDLSNEQKEEEPIAGEEEEELPGLF